MTEPAGAPAALRVVDLRTHFFTDRGVARAVDGVSFELQMGEVLGLVGESGSGKSMTGFSLLGLVDPPGRIVSGQIFLQGEDLTGIDAQGWRALRGRRIAMIFQDPMLVLNPVLRVETQMIEALRAHERIGRGAARARALAALEAVGIAAPRERLLAYPHQLSGGMRQRVAIAIAILNRPDILICDEPTTALDVTTQGQILYTMQKLSREAGTALLWITHDLSVIAGLADRVAVLYAGRIVESGTTAQILDAPRHPYTHGLIASTPAAAARRLAARAVGHLGAEESDHAPGPDARGVLEPIPGVTPSLLNLPTGCPFRVRCTRAQSDCTLEPELETQADGRLLRCFHPVPAAGGRDPAGMGPA